LLRRTTLKLTSDFSAWDAATEFPLAFVAEFVNRFTTLGRWGKGARNALENATDIETLITLKTPATSRRPMTR
jgi:hypothetical protein